MNMPIESGIRRSFSEATGSETDFVKSDWRTENGSQGTDLTFGG